tara:strand:- start:1458 stop:2747 length:1290 start_codon:yes stop_codon:yes gene_type:complete
VERQILFEGVQPLFSTPTSAHHFFGYYDVSPLDATGRYMLATSVDFAPRMLTAEDKATLCLFDLTTGERRVLGTTRAFNWQQGCRFQWLGPRFNEWVIYNDREEDRFVSVVLNVHTGEKRILPLPVYSVEASARWAVCVNHERHYWCRPGYNYLGIENPRWKGHLPEGDGISLLQLNTGEHRLIIKTEDMAARNALSSMENGNHLLEHLMFNPSGNRFVFFHRWETGDGGIFTRVYTAGWDGKDIHCLGEAGSYSHNCWQDNGRLLMWCGQVSSLKQLRRYGALTRYVLKPLIPLYRRMFGVKSAFRQRLNRGNYRLFADFGADSEVMGEGILLEDGHPSFMPGSRDIFLSDTYQDERDYRHLFAYSLKAGRVLPLGRFYSPPETNNTSFRCDLHPRWSRDHNIVCIDSLHTGMRQMHCFDVSKALHTP